MSMQQANFGLENGDTKLTGNFSQSSSIQDLKTTVSKRGPPPVIDILVFAW